MPVRQSGQLRYWMSDSFKTRFLAFFPRPAKPVFSKSSSLCYRQLANFIKPESSPPGQTMFSLFRILLAGTYLPLFAIATIVFGQSTAPPRADTQLWNEVQVAIPVNKQT